METNNLKAVYDVSYFIRKFEAIPEDKWCIDNYNYKDKFCALGHCGVTKENAIKAEKKDEPLALNKIFGKLKLSVSKVNDGCEKKYLQPMPKQRILAALYDIKKMQEPKATPPVKIRYVSVPESISQQVKETILS